MTLHHYDRREAGTRLLDALATRETGWTFYGYTPDRSDWQTDYFAPAHWSGVATRSTLAGVAVLAFDVNAYTVREHSGKTERRCRPGAPLPCPRCHGETDGRDPVLGGWTLDAARETPDAYHRAELLAEHPDAVPVVGSKVGGVAVRLPADRGMVATVHAGLLGVVSPIPFCAPGQHRACLICCGHGTIAGDVEQYDGDTWPTFEATPRGLAWVLTVDGRRVGSGRGIERLYRGGTAAAAALAAELDALCDAAGAARPASAPQPGAVLAAGSATVTTNADRGGVEVRFPSKPAPEVLATLKAAGWRWSRFSGCWYTRDTPEARALALRLAGAEESAA